jgi:hypothetical protein
VDLSSSLGPVVPGRFHDRSQVKQLRLTYACSGEATGEPPTDLDTARTAPTTTPSGTVPASSRAAPQIALPRLAGRVGNVTEAARAPLSLLALCHPDPRCTFGVPE